MTTNLIIQKEVNSLQKRIDKYQEKIKITLGNTLVICEQNFAFGNKGKACRKSFLIKDLIYIQTHYYSEEAYNERWIEGEGNFICPNCNYRNRLNNRPEIEKLKHSFKSIKEEFRDK